MQRNLGSVILMGLLQTTYASAATYTLDASSVAGNLSDAQNSPFSLRTQGNVPVFGLGFADSGIAGVAASAASAGATLDFNTNSVASASSTFQDTLLIDDPTLNGTTGSVTIRLNSTFRALGDGVNVYRGQWSAFFGSGGGKSDFFQFGVDAGQEDPYLIPAEITSPVVFGSNFSAALNAFALTQLFSTNESHFSTIGHAIGFGAITSVRDADGNEVNFGNLTSSASAKVSSLSGIDYLVDHPLPSIETLPEPDLSVAAILVTIAIAPLRTHCSKRCNRAGAESGSI